MSLRAILTALAASLGVLGLVGGLALAVASTQLHQATRVLDAALEAVHSAEQLEVDLVTYDAIAGGRLHGDVGIAAKLDVTRERRLVDVRMRVAMVADPALVDRLDREVRDYLAGQTPVDEPLHALRTLIDACEVRAAGARRDAAWWNDLANVVGVTSAVVFLTASVAIGLWLRRLLLPVSAIGNAMKSFGDGRHDRRARVDGPRELRHIAQCFNAMAAALAEQSKRELTFLAGVAHDLRNPIGTLKITAAQLGSQPRTLAPAVEARMLGMLERQADHLDRMVDDLLDRAGIEAGALELRPALHDLRDVVRHAVAVRQASTTSHRLDLSLPADELFVACDSTRIQQVLDNLVSNAIKYSPAGTTVEVAAQHDGDARSVVLSVTDHGVGIKRDETELVFAPFQRVGALRDSVRGVGLGLSNVRKIVEAHGGVIEVDSQLGHGSTFRVRLPSASHRDSSRRSRGAPSAST